MKNMMQTNTKNKAGKETGLSTPENPLDVPFFDRHESQPIVPHGPPETAFSHWLSVDQIRRMQRMRRQTVIDAMNSGELPYERRGRVRYARLCDVIAWEEQRLTEDSSMTTRRIDPDLEYLAR
jgi:hypothetical protein